MKHVTINLYSFNELQGKARERAINEHTEFLEGEGMESENEEGELIREDYTPTEDEVIDNIEANDYIYFEDGSLASCVTYCGGHEKAGTTEFKFKGRVYNI